MSFRLNGAAAPTSSGSLSVPNPEPLAASASPILLTASVRTEHPLATATNANVMTVRMGRMAGRLLPKWHAECDMRCVLARTRLSECRGKPYVDAEVFAIERDASSEQSPAILCAVCRCRKRERRAHEAGCDGTTVLLVLLFVSEPGVGAQRSPGSGGFAHELPAEVMAQRFAFLPAESHCRRTGRFGISIDRHAFPGHGCDRSMHH